ncbi:MAG: FAD-dependent oxidoreductase [bacterium]
MTQIFDVAVIGAGVVGSAIARELSRYDLKVALVESASDVGMGTSKASTAIWHTGFDAKPGTLEATLMRRSYALMDTFMPGAKVAHERLGAILIAWNQEQLDSLPALRKKAHENGVVDVEIISPEEISKREPHINKGALGGLLVPGEGILCTFTVPLALATQAVLNGVELILNHTVKAIAPEGEVHLLDGKIRARYVVNAAGLYSDDVNACFGHHQFTVTPRRGQLIVYDKLARSLVNHVLLPVPTSKTKGVLISPTVYGNILLGPTAEDLPDKTATHTTADGLNMLLGKGREILPQLLDEEVTTTYSGLRAATEHSDYQIEMHAAQRYLCVGGIRSTGISAAMGIAEYAAELLRNAGLDLHLKAEFKLVKMPSIGQADIRPHQDAVMIGQNPHYAEMVCHCERVSRGELTDAQNATIPATHLDGLRRRTRASQGRCQGFNCHAALVKTLESGAAPGCQCKADQPEHLEKPVPSVQHKKILIVGAGPAGIAAAIELKKLGVDDVLVVDREPEGGGMPRFCDHTGFGRADLWRLYSGPRYARHYREMAQTMGVNLQTATTITGWKNSSTLTYTSPGGLGEIEAGAILLATGVRERPRAARLIPGTRPAQGVFTTGSLQRFIYQEHLPVGKRAVIIGAELVSLSALMTLWHAGVECVMMTTEEPRHQIEFPYVAMKWALADILMRTPVVTNVRISNIFGNKCVEGIELTRTRLPGSPKKVAGGLLGLDQAPEVFPVECDTVIFTGNWIPENELARLGGLTINPVTHGPEIDVNYQSSVRGVFVAGNLLRGVETADRCALEGIKAARAMAKNL